MNKRETKAIRVVACVNKRNCTKVIFANNLYSGDVFNINRANTFMQKKKTYFLVCKSGAYYIADPTNIYTPL